MTSPCMEKISGRKLLVICLLINSMSLAAGQMRFMVLGDWGDNTPEGQAAQRQVAVAMDTVAQQQPATQFILSTGDNFYPDGVESLDDFRFEDYWRNVYNETFIKGLPWYLSAGNHDYGEINDGREMYQVNYTEVDPERRWLFPSLYHAWHVTGPDGATVHLVVTDTQAVVGGQNDPAAQLAWLEAELSGSTDDFLIAIGHHPAWDAGTYGPGEEAVRTEVFPLLQRYRADVFLGGHEHCLEHIVNATDAAGDVETVVTGAGGNELFAYNATNDADINQAGYTLRHFEADYGFVALDVYFDRLECYFYNRESAVVYSFTRPNVRAPNTAASAINTINEPALWLWALVRLATYWLVSV